MSAPDAVDVRSARADEDGLAAAASALIAAAAAEHDLARRSPEWLAGKIRAGHAVIALLGRELVGFGYWAPWEDGLWVSHSGLVVRADLRGRGLGRRIKEAMLAGSRRSYPDARILSLTTSPAVLALNRSLGFRPASLDELTRDPVFWAGCATCRNADAARASGRRCCCEAMVLDPGAPA